MKISLKNSIAVLMLLVGLYSCAQKTTDYKLVWADNFDKSSLNIDYWNIEVNGDGGGNSEMQYYRKENISIEKEPVTKASCLVITARKENYLGKVVTSGRINTRNKVAVKYGKIEARIKMPKTANGLWPAFWMLGNDIDKAPWPKCGEIDILEAGHYTGITNGTQDRYFNGACHYGENWNNGDYPKKSEFTTNPYSIQNDFHLFTLIWTENAIRLYLDLDKFPNAKPYFELPIDTEDAPNKAARYYKKEFYMLFNLAVGGNYPKIYNINEVTALENGEAKMYIDYIRVYQKTTGNETISVNKSSHKKKSWKK